jgi:hypothetical protein
MNFIDLVDAAGGSTALWTILAFATFGAVIVTFAGLAVTVRASVK